MLSSHRRYAVRMFAVLVQFLWARLTGRLRHVDAVFVGFLAQPIFPLIRLFWKGPLVADAYFSLYDTLVFDKQLARPGSLRGRICFWLDRYMLRHADFCFTDTRAHVKYLEDTFRTPQGRVSRLWISSDHRPAPRPPFPGGTFQVFFWGGFIPLQGVETIIQAAALVADQDIQFTVFGNGQTYDHCLRLKRELGVSNVAFHGWKTAKEIAEFAAQSHLALGIFGTTEKARRVIPNKVFEALALGIPLITGASEAMDELLTDGHDVLLTPPGDARRLAEKIVWVRDHYRRALEIAAQGSATFQAVASPAAIETTLREELHQLLHTRQGRCVKRSMRAGTTGPPAIVSREPPDTGFMGSG
jgi:glycosyltransferase involved in cell wall biosynthesis